jgi:phage gpG-like protein
MDADLEQSLNDFQNKIMNFAEHFNFTQFVNTTRNIIRNSIEDNFQSEGRYGSGVFGGGTTKWQQSKKTDGQTLSGRGRLALSIQVNATQDNNNIVFEISSYLPYAAIHQFGGVINHPGGTAYKMYRGRKYQLMDRQTIFVKNSWAASNPTKILGRTKPHKIVIPARPFIVLQDDDLAEIAENLKQYIVDALTTD